MVQYYYGGAPGQSPYTGAPASNAANLQQYNDVMDAYNQQIAAFQGSTAGVNQGYENMYAAAQGLGQSELAQQQLGFQQQNAQLMSQDINTGNYNTSMMGSQQQGQQTQQYLQNLGLNEQILQNRLGIGSQELQYDSAAQQQLAGLQGNRAQFMGSVTNQPIQNQTIPWNAAQQGLTTGPMISYQAGGGAPTIQSPASNYTSQGGQGVNVGLPPQGSPGYSQYITPPGGMAQSYGVGAQPQQGQGADPGSGYGYDSSGGSDYWHGGKVHGPAGKDVVPAHLTAGEFVLSKEMIADMHAGKLTIAGLKKMIREGHGKGGPGYDQGGMVMQSNQLPAGGKGSYGGLTNPNPGMNTEDTFYGTPEAYAALTGAGPQQQAQPQQQQQTGYSPLPFSGSLQAPAGGTATAYGAGTNPNDNAGSQQGSYGSQYGYGGSQGYAKGGLVKKKKWFYGWHQG